MHAKPGAVNTKVADNEVQIFGPFDKVPRRQKNKTKKLAAADQTSLSEVKTTRLRSGGSAKGPAMLFTCVARPTAVSLRTAADMAMFCEGANCNSLRTHASRIPSGCTAGTQHPVTVGECNAKLGFTA